MAINLKKGDDLAIAQGLQRVGIGLGWDPSISGATEFDLDASAFLLGPSGRIPKDEFFVFFNNQVSPDGAVKSSGDDRTGGSSEGDDETLTVEFGMLNPAIEKIMVVVTIYEYEKRKQNFGQVRNSFIRIYNDVTSEEICRYDLEEDFSTETAIEFGCLTRKGGGWVFEALGKGYNGGLEYFVSKYS